MNTSLWSPLCSGNHLNSAPPIHRNINRRYDGYKAAVAGGHIGTGARRWRGAVGAKLGYWVRAKNHVSVSSYRIYVFNLPSEKRPPFLQFLFCGVQGLRQRQSGTHTRLSFQGPRREVSREKLHISRDTCANRNRAPLMDGVRGP